MNFLPFDSWRWPQIVGVAFCLGFFTSLSRGLANAIVLGAASVLFWGPVIWVILWFRRRGRDGA
jgi:hypothetical protein